MFVTIHAAAATIIGKKVISPPLAFLLGMVSHFILDFIPHGDQDLGQQFVGHRFGKFLQPIKKIRAMYLYSTIDAFLLLIFVLFLFQNIEFQNANSVIWAILGGVLPDVVMTLYFTRKFKGLGWFNKLHTKNHAFIVKYIKRDWPLKTGIAMQVLLFGLLYLGIIFL